MAYVQRFENKHVAEQVAHCLFGREKME